jgi:autotransporter-associated beta strand protein
MYYYQTSVAQNWLLVTRTPQVVAQNIDQELLYNYKSPSGASLSSLNPAPSAFPFPASFTVGSQYTVQYRVTLSSPGTLTISNALYAGTSTAGTLIYSNVAAAVTGTSFLTTNFDGFAIGFRAGGGSSLPSWTNDINSVSVVAGLVANAGPYFSLTNQLGGSGCEVADVALNGSVTTNVYWLYTNGVNTGQSITGTGSLIDFGNQSLANIYTIVASNPTTGNIGPMYGNVIISVSAPVITVQPANVSVVTNAPALFTIAATGNALTYQWYKNGIALANGGDYSGVTTTNLLVSPAQAADAATTANGYFVVVQDPCGDSVTSSPNASLTLLAPHNLVWQGNNSANWDSTTLNFTNSAGTSVAFSYGDNVTFNDTTPNYGIIISTNVTPSVVAINGSQAYYFYGPGSITGFGGLIDNDTNVVTIISTNTYTGGTIIASNAILSLGNQNSGNDGFIGGVANINTNGTLNYDYYQDQNINNTIAGSGTVNYNSGNGGTFTLGVSIVNSNFTGVANLVAGVRVHAQNGSVYPFGNGSTINVQPFSQAWCDTATYNNTFNIAGTGWPGTAPATGAISVFGSIFTGPINLTADARISGTISGGTILSTISGPYTLEIYGNAGSYVLSMGPTNNGVDSYSATLITSGTVRALNTNAISTGPLTMDSAADLRLNSYNLPVANLGSTNQGVVSGTGATIENTGATNAILTFGADNSSKEFDGTFFNGGTGTLGITKVGTGTETLTGASTNTGPVTVMGGTLLVSGSFNNASQITVGSGAVYDAGGTLTLNSGQTLSGQGRVNGNVVVSSGATLNPGLTTGTLTVSGAATMNIGSTYLVNLDRTNSATYGKVSASGAITYAGTLLVTNVGPVLHVGDTFALFSSANTSFSSIVLETNDVANGVTYTWNNNVTTSGSISVATVTSPVNSNPTNIAFSVTSGTNIVLSWPSDHTGWTLQSQTNVPGIGIGTNWANVPGSTGVDTVTNFINPTNGSVFYRLMYNP